MNEQSQLLQPIEETEVADPGIRQSQLLQLTPATFDTYETFDESESDSDNDPEDNPSRVRRHTHRLSASIISSRSVLFESTRIIPHDAATTKSSYAGANTWSLLCSGPTLSAVLNLTVSIAGGMAMVTLPGSFANVGWMEGSLLLLLSVLAAAMSLFFVE